MKVKFKIKKIFRFVTKILFWPISIFKNNKNDINWYSRFDEQRSIVSTFVVTIVGLVAFISSLFAIPYFFNYIIIYKNIIILIGQIYLIVFFLLSIIGGLFRIISYSNWMKNEHDRIYAIINGISDNDKRSIIRNLIVEGKTIELLKFDNDIFKEISPPHLWNSYRVTQLYVIISIIGIAISAITLIK